MQRLMFIAVLLLLLAACFPACGGGEDGSTRSCDDYQCPANSVCVETEGIANCICEDGYVNYNSSLGCIPAACEDYCRHGACSLENGQPVCACEAAYSGTQCNQCAEGYVEDGLVCVPGEDLPEECVGFACNQGACRVNEAQQPYCVCNTGYAGDHCDACADHYKLIDGLCLPAGSDGDSDGDDDPCQPNPCSEDHRGVCVADGDDYTCDCDEGYIENRDGECVEDDNPLDPCDPNPCNVRYRTACEAEGDGYVCNCDAGFEDDDGMCLPVCDPAQASNAICDLAHESAPFMVSANGHGAVIWNKSAKKMDVFLEHVYRNWDEGHTTHDVLFDTYFGVRTPAGSVWLNTVAPSYVGYLDESGIIHVVQNYDGLRIDSYYYAPWQLARPALLMLAKVTNEGASRQVSIFSIHNYHLGNPDNPADLRYLNAADEQISYTSGGFLEKGPAGAIFHKPLGDVFAYDCTPGNPWQKLTDGEDLGNNGNAAVGDDRVAGFQHKATLATGESSWFGSVSALERGGQGTGLAAELAAVYSDMTPEEILDEAAIEWENWRGQPIEGLSSQELFVYRQAEAVLRMGQVWETSDLSKGQILASMPPGNWNICWMRDMAYAIAGLIYSGHHTEARAALEFVLKADSGHYQSYAGVPYQVTITRYFGRGKEETDSNEFGPNIEFDGFGLFLWVLYEYVQASGDRTLLTTYGAIIKEKIADALLGLMNNSNDLIKADSSIWEVHWDGKQKQYSYTSVTASHGLCMYSKLLDDSAGAPYAAAAADIRDALEAHMLDGSNVLASSLEELHSGSGYHDAATVEAFNWLLFDPNGNVAHATFQMYINELQVAHGLGFFRNDDGGWYDSQEWVFVDLRGSIAARLAGDNDASDELIAWITAQALSNQGLIAELHHPSNADYEGEAPMVGFGSGGYIIALKKRSEELPDSPYCGQWR